MSEFAALLRYLDRNRESPVINLGFSGLGDSGVAEIANYVRDNPFVQYLDLRGNEITATGAKALAKALRVNRSLKGLILKSNSIGADPEGVDALCSILVGNLTIAHLDLSFNQVDLQGCRRISEMLTENAAIEHLDVSWNDFGYEGGLAFIAGIKKNRKLLKVKIAGCMLGEELQHEIQAKLRLNKNEVKKNIIPAKITAELLLALEKPDPEEGSDEEKLFKKYKAFMADYPPKPIEQKTREDLDAMMRQACAKRRAAVNLEDKLLYDQITEYCESTIGLTGFHLKESGDAEERERLATEAFLEREKRYTREIRQTEIDLQVAMNERTKLEHEIAYRQKELKRHNDEHDVSILANEDFKVSAAEAQKGMRADIAGHRQDITVLEGKLALQSQDLELLEGENERLREHVKRFQKDINAVLC